MQSSAVGVGIYAMAISQTNPFGQVTQTGARGRFVESAPSSVRSVRGARVNANPDATSPASSATETRRTTEESRVSATQDAEKVTGAPGDKTSKSLVDFYT